MITLALMNALGAMLPGPDTFLMTRLGLQSRRHAYASVLGIQTGVLVWVTLTVFGFGAVLNAFPALLGVIQVLGGGWLVYMGQGTLRAGLSRSADTDLADADARLGALRTTYLSGLTTNLSNPKIVLYMSAMIAPLLPPSPSIGLMAGIVLMLWGTSLVLFLILVTAISTEAMRRKMLRAGPAIDVVAGGFFAIVGVVLFVRGATLLFT